MSNEYPRDERPATHPEHNIYGPSSTVGMQPSARPGQYGQQEFFGSPLPHDDARVTAVLCYALGWLSGLLFVIFTRQSRYVRFHALQSLLFFGSISLIDIGLLSMGHHMFEYIYFLKPGLEIGFMLLNFIAFVGWLIAMVQAYKGNYYHLPIVGDIAARTLGLGASVK